MTDEPEDALDPGYEASSDPFTLFEAWFGEAEAREPADPNAMALATVDATGLPNVRMVLLKGLDNGGHQQRGFVFYTNLDSAKAHEIRHAARAALLFHWKSLRRQVRIRGTLTEVGADEADRYFATRPRGSRIGAWASAQSRPLESRSALEAAVARHGTLFHEGDVPRPRNWSGWRLVPVEIEFWHDRPHRLHDRLVFRRPAMTEPWSAARLYP